MTIAERGVHMTVRLRIAYCMTTVLFASLACPSPMDAFVWDNVWTKFERFLCKRNTESERCVRIIEQEKIEGSGGLVTRKGNTLEFKLKTGHDLRLPDVDLLEDQSNANSFVKYYFESYDNRIDHFIVRNSYFEGESFSVINRSNGVVYTLDAFPNVSPDNRRICTVDICDFMCKNELKIFTVSNRGITLEYSLHPEEYWASGDARWIDARTIQVRKEIAAKLPNSDDPDFVFKTFSLVLTPKGWKIQE